MNRYRQTCKWNQSSIWYTAIVILVFEAVCIVGSAYDSVGSNIFVAILRWILILILLCGLYYCPRYIFVTSSSLIIKRILWAKEIPLDQIVAVAPYQKTTRNFVCMFGVCGILGYWGHFYNQKIGPFFIYATSMKQLVFLTLASGRNYIISCEDANDMAEHITRQLHQNTPAAASCV